ncbi:MAG TPA: rhodanese-like domain-containing protein [Thermoanaerobaculia bacterium]|nr:rhodanese-like domain-containing protein [Thermoanaerobaculia bacterium]
MRRALLVAAVVAGALAAIARSPHRTPQLDVTRLATLIETEKDHVTAVELAHWIRDRKPGLRVIDLRTPKEYAGTRVPSSVNLSLRELATRELTRSDTIVLISERGGHAAQGWVLLQARGYRNVFFLRGGMEEWVDDVLRSPRQKELSRYFGGVRSGDGC